MKNFSVIRTMLLSMALSLLFSYGFADSPQTPVKKKVAVNTTTSIKALGSDDGIVINYSVAEGTTNACLVVSDIMGNKLKVVKLSEGKGRISLNKENLDKGSSSAMYNCTLLVNGNKIASQPVKLLNF